jgi:alcohol dehydrogenase (cytochrome c)
MKRRVVLVIIGVLVLGLLGMGLGLSSRGVSWRLRVLRHKANGQIKDLNWVELLGMLRPASRIYVEGLAYNPNPFIVIKNPYSSPGDLSAGRELFRDRCAGCHGLNARGGDHGPDLLEPTLKNGDSPWAMFRVVQRGVPGTSMVPAALTETERWQVVAFLSAERAGSAKPNTGDDKLAVPLDVSASRLEHSEGEPANWLMYSGRYAGWRYTSLETINRKNITDLKLAWVLQSQTTEWVETSPVVVDGVMYLTEPPSNVVALDAKTGQRFWTYWPEVPADVLVCCGRVNRGVAILGNKVFVGTLDGRLVALDARTGKEVWQTRVADYKAGYTITVAPLAVRDKIIVGVAGGEYGIRGFLDAYDAKSGRRAWRFYTIPGPNEPGNDTWTDGESWRTGGGPTWVTGSFDPDLGLVYWGVGNPSPDYDGTVRPGDNLFTNSIVALDISTGRRAWHFQFTPHDEHDYDSNQIPVLVDKVVDGKVNRLMLWANRNGFYYVLDRQSGQFLAGTPFAKQNWAERLDQSGRPILTEFAHPTRKGVLTWPGGGATNWWPPSYSPIQDLFFVPYLERAKVFFTRAGERSRQGGVDGMVMGSASEDWGEASFHTGIRALDPLTGRVIWDQQMPSRLTPGTIGGVLTTAGGLAFVGDNTTFYALDSSTGQALWNMNLGGAINAPPISFAVDSRQFVIIAAGNSVYAFSM